MSLVLPLLALWLVPVVVFIWARRRAPKKLFRLTGVALGLVVAPASFGLYGLYFVGPLPGLVGLLVGFPLMSFHSGPGFELATMMGLREPRTVVHGVQHVYIALLDAAVWSLVYGAAGWVIDQGLGIGDRVLARGQSESTREDEEQQVDASAARAHEWQLK